jgi:hypothetical protein
MREPVLMKCGCVAQGVRTMSRGVPIDPPIPACLTHDCIESADSKPDLTGRMAKCTYSHANPKGRQRPEKSPVPSSFDLAFFEYCGEGSREATELCKCGYHKVAHEKNGGKCPANSRTKPPSRKFTPKGPQEFDRFYCGCFGWD